MLDIEILVVGRENRDVVMASLKTKRFKEVFDNSEIMRDYYCQHLGGNVYIVSCKAKTMSSVIVTLEKTYITGPYSVHSMEVDEGFDQKFIREYAGKQLSLTR